MKKFLAVLAAALMMAAVTVVLNDPGEVAVTGSADAGSTVESGNLASLPPIALIATFYLNTLNANNCNEWNSQGNDPNDSDYWYLDWNFDHTTFGVTKEQVGGLDSSTPPSPSGTEHFGGKPDEKDNLPGWNYAWEGSADSTKLNISRVALKTELDTPCAAVKAAGTVSGNFITPGEDWIANLLTKT